MKPRLSTLWGLLTEPAPSVRDPERRLNSQWLAAVLILLLPLGFLMAAIPPLTYDNYTLADAIDVRVVIAVAIGSIIPYLLCRYGYYQVATALMTLIASAAILFVGVSSDRLTDLHYVLLPVLFISVLLPTRVLRVFVVLITAGGLLIPVMMPAIGWERVALEALRFVLVGSGMVLLVSRHRDALEHLRTAALTETNDALEREVHEREQAEKTLRESEERLKSLFENIPVGLYRTTPDGRILMANPAILQMLHMSSFEELVRHNLETDSAEAAYARAYFKERIERKGQVFGLESEWTRADGTRFFVSESAKAIRDDQGNTLYYEGTVEDITERKQAEQRNLELAVERERVKVLERFIGDASHDLKTPVTTMKVSLDVIRRSPDPAKQQRHLDILGAQVAHLESLLEDLLNMVRLDRATEVKLRLLDLSALVRTVVLEHGPLAEHKRHDITLALDANTLPVHADYEKLSLAVTSLVTNAFNYTPDKGTIAVRTYIEGDCAIIEVRDNGIGINEDDLPHIFKRFYRGGQARSTVQGGLGLGLAIAQKIVEVHQGRIEVESKPGEGSTFRILLPLAA